MRVRVRYAKLGPARFIGSRELAELFCRATRRGGIPVALSQGHHPLPRLSFSPALPIGVASDSEFVDVELSASTEPEVLAAKLDAQLPEGLRVMEARTVPSAGTNLAGAIRGFRYAVELPEGSGNKPRIEERLAAFNRATSFPVRKRTKRKRTKTIDIRQTTAVRLVRSGCLEVAVHSVTEGAVAPAQIVGALLDLDDTTCRRLRIRKLETLFHESCWTAAPVTTVQERDPARASASAIPAAAEEPAGPQARPGAAHDPVDRTSWRN
jgi:radical SAM-linked protein